MKPQTRSWISALALIASLILPILTVAQTIRYVSSTGTNSNPATATSWASSTTNLQGAINSLSATGGQVWVTGGTYRPGGNANTNRAVSFTMRPNVAIYGGFAGTETTLTARPAVNLTTPSATTLSGDIGTIGSTTDNSYHVISNPAGLVTTAVLDGFVITGGNANAAADFFGNRGGGVWNQSGQPTFRRCLFVGNYALYGGAMNNYGAGSGNSASPVLVNCSFQGNTADYGGAIYNDGIAGGISNPSLTNCSFQANSAGIYGGAMYNDGSNGRSTPSVINGSFQSNTAPFGGGRAIFQLGTGGGNTFSSLTNCVFFGNGGGETFASFGADIIASYSWFEVSVTGYRNFGGNLTRSISPFASPTSVLLAANSSAINNGDPTTTSATVGSTDLAGNARFVGCRVDMGAVEHQIVSSPSRLYVAASQTALNGGDGLTWATAYKDLQDALDYGCPITEIWVAGGLYKPTTGTSRSISFAMRPGTAIYGGFSGSETEVFQRPNMNQLPGPSSTTLSGDIGTVGNTTDNSYHVISNPAGLTTTAILDGFVIMGGNANNFFPDNVGGGMYNNGTGSGKVCSPTILNSLFISNMAATGGAMYNDSNFSGISNPIITACSFQSNIATGSGGAAIYNNGSSPTLTNCIFQRNSTSGTGGAMFTVGNGSSTLTNCSFQGNTAANGGAVVGSGNTNLVLTNSVLFGNGGANTFFTFSPATITLRYSLVEPTATGYTNGPGNITTTINPFISTTSVDIVGTSLPVNTGDPTTTTATVGLRDPTQRPRITGCRVDMGAIEYQYVFTAPSRLYVAASQTATDGGDGLTWATAYKDLRNATAYGCPVADIWVAAGMYKPTTDNDRAVSFAMRPGTAIYGGFVGNETTLNQRPAINPVSGNPSSSTLSGDIGTIGNNTDNSYHVISNPAGLTTTAILDGFVITGGNGDEAGLYGGGIFNNGEGSGTVCSPTIRNCVFAANRADVGGAICNYGIGGGNSSPTISNCLFQSNTGTRGGGAIFNYGESGTSSPSLTNCAFLGNAGGALRNEAFSGGVSSPRLTNCSFQGNTNGFAPGGVLYNSVGSSVALTNCALFGNGGASNNGANTFFNESGATITMRYSLVEPSVTGYASGPGNLNTTTSPFSTTATVALRGSALALNNGDPATTTATVGTTDLAGTNRFVGCRIDMGAVEYQVVSSYARIYVSASQTAPDGGDGLTWATAYKDLQSALTGCTTAEIWVARGTYPPTTGTDRAISFAMRPGTAIYGGFLGNETSLSQRPAINLTTPSTTTLSGDIGTVGNNTDNSYHVINNLVGLSETVVLDGFVVTGGNANGSSPDNTGGGMYNNGAGSGNGSSPGIRNCFFVGNQATFGGAIFNGGFQNGNSSPAITNTVFQSNTAVNGGGAIYNAGYGSGNSSPALINCAFLRNGATNGGSLYNDATNGSSSPALINCSFQGNTATNGGGVYNYADGGSSNPTLTNCVLFGNGAANTFFNNSPATTTLRYSLTEPTVTGYTAGPGNLTATATPFTTTTSVVLSATALALNTGDPTTTTALVGVTDVAGGVRIVNGRIDMGAYEVPCGVLAITRLFVRAGATGANTGLNWANAFTDLQSALNYDCTQNLAEIWVASGTYKPTSGTSRTISFAMRPNIAIYGGFAGTEISLSQRVLTNPGSGQPSSSTLSGDIGTVGNIADNSYHVISNPMGLTTTAVLDGFVITGGNSNSGFPNYNGGAVYNNGDGSGNFCSPTIRNCLFQANSARYGGAMYNSGSSSGSSSPMLINCSFQANTSDDQGGAMYNFGSSPTLINCSFQANTASSSGGAIYSSGPTGSNSGPTLINCVLFGNGGDRTISNLTATTTARYSLFDAIVTGYTSGPGNLTTTVSPFASTATTRLRIGSPAINAGDPATTSATVGTTDLAGNPRFVGTLDMGATEFQNEIVSVAVGNWNVPGTWNANRVPQVGDRVRLRHIVTIPTNHTALGGTLVYDAGGRLVYQAGGRLQVGQ
jgi:hypothetical protein